MRNSFFMSVICSVLGVSLVACTAATGPELDAQVEELAAPKTIAADPALVSMLNGLSKVARFGPSLEAFVWKEGPVGIGTGCKTMSASEAVRLFNDVVDEVVAGGDASEAPELTAKAVANGKLRFKALAGNKAYRVCESSTSGGRSVGHRTTFAGKLNLALEVAYED